MDVSKLALIILRILQLIFSVILLAVCADASEFLNGSTVQNDLDRNKNLMLYGLIPQIQFGAFVGAWGLLTSLVGIVAAFIEAIPWIAQMVLDGLALLFFFADAVVSICFLSPHFATSRETSYLRSTKQYAPRALLSRCFTTNTRIGSRRLALPPQHLNRRWQPGERSPRRRRFPLARLSCHPRLASAHLLGAEEIGVIYGKVGQSARVRRAEGRWRGRVEVI